MKTKPIISIIITAIIVAGVVLYLIALDNRYKQIYGAAYFDIWTGKTVKAATSGSREVVIEYSLSKTKYQVETDPNAAPRK